jgi:putative photosynthetic complex assembly protein
MSQSSEPTVPRAAIWAAGGLIALTVVLSGVGRLGGFGMAEPAPVLPAESVELRFEDQTDGSVLVSEVTTGNTIAVLGPGTNGFVRGVLRGFARERRQYEIGKEPPFRLTRWDGGGLSLEDPQTGRTVELQAFGQTNYDAFAQLLRRVSEQS